MPSLRLKISRFRTKIHLPQHACEPGQVLWLSVVATVWFVGQKVGRKNSVNPGLASNQALKNQPLDTNGNRSFVLYGYMLVMILFQHKWGCFTCPVWSRSPQQKLLHSAQPCHCKLLHQNARGLMYSSGRASFWGDAYTVRKWTRNLRTRFGNAYQRNRETNAAFQKHL